MRASSRLRLMAAFAVAGFVAVADHADAQAVWSPTTNDLYSNPANWVGGAVPVNDGSVTINLPTAVGAFVFVYADINANVAGIVFPGSSLNPLYEFFTVNSGTLTIGGGGISAGTSNYPEVYNFIPTTLSASQTWASNNGFIYVQSDIGEVAGNPATLTVSGNLYLFGANTFTGGLVVTPGSTLYLQQTGAGMGPVTIGDNAVVESNDSTATVPGNVQLGDNVTLGTIDFPSYGNTLNFNGTVTLAQQNTNLYLNSQSSVYINGNLTGPANAQLEIIGNAPTLPHDGGSQLIFSGAFSQVSGVALRSTALILAPTGDPAASVASLSPAGITTDNTGIGSSFSTELGNTSYLGLDGTFANRGAVSNFLATFGPSMGAANFAGTLGFDSFVKVVTPGSTNTFDDPIDVSPFSGEYFLGLGTESTAILGPDAVITPANETYMFGGGGGTLTVLSPLTDDGSTPRSLLMTTTPSPLTLLVNGTADYTGGTVSNGGVLIFENEVPLVGSIKNFAGYVGYTEAVTNIANAQQFVNLFDVNSSNSVIGFDAVDSNIGRTVSDDINLTAFTGLSAPFLGTSTNVTLSGMITPANGTYQFAAVKGGRLTVASNLTVTSAGAVIGLVNPIENLGTNSVVTMTGTNTYGGGTVFNSGTLFIDNDSALGAATGTLSVPNGTGLSTGSTSLFTPYLAPYGGGTITLAMPITVAPFQNGPGIQLGNIDGGTMLTLTGAITDYPGTHGGIAINGPVTITSSGNTYSGGTVFEGGSYSALTLTPNATLGCGNISTQVSGSIIPSGGNVTITNGILINGNTLTLGSNLNPNLLTLGTVLGGGGAISGYGTLDIESDVTLNSASSYDGTVSVNNAMVTLGNLTALGTGPVGLNSSTLTYGTGNPELLNLTGDQFSTINLASGATLTLDSETSGFPPTYSGAISGDATTTVIKTGAGGEDLNGTATYGGGTTIAQGTLVVGSNQAIGSGPALVQSSGVLIADDLVVLTNAVTVNSGGGLGGGGTFSPPGGVVFASGAILQPGSPLLGRAVETLNFGTAVTFGAGGVYQFVVEDAGGSPGTGFSSVNLAAPLTISATSGSQFTVQVSAIDSPYGDVGPAANFNASQPYSWTLLTAPSISGFSSTAFFVDSSLFAAQNPLLGGSFAIDEVNGNTLTLDFTPVPEPSTWILLGCGVGLVGFGSWRRLRSSAVRA